MTSNSQEANLNTQQPSNRQCKEENGNRSGDVQKDIDAIELIHVEQALKRESRRRPLCVVCGFSILSNYNVKRFIENRNKGFLSQPEKDVVQKNGWFTCRLCCQTRPRD